jgi:hypothetical protein
VERAVTWVAGQGITQFIDLGAGLPTAPNTHATAQAVSPAAAVAYVDNDPVVISHLTALLAHHADRAAVIAGFATMYNHKSADFASFFGDLEIMPPGLGDARRIRPGWSELTSVPRRPDRILAGIARVPRGAPEP